MPATRIFSIINSLPFLSFYNIFEDDDTSFRMSMLTSIGNAFSRRRFINYQPFAIIMLMGFDEPILLHDVSFRRRHAGRLSCLDIFLKMALLFRC